MSTTLDLVNTLKAELKAAHITYAGQDFEQQHLAGQKLPASEKRAYTLVIGMRSWLFAAFRDSSGMTDPGRGKSRPVQITPRSRSAWS